LEPILSHLPASFWTISVPVQIDSLKGGLNKLKRARQLALPGAIELPNALLDDIHSV